MLMEKLAKDVAELADAKIKTDLKYTTEKYIRMMITLVPENVYCQIQRI